MAGFNYEALSKAGNYTQGAMGLIGAGIGAYKNVPQAQSVEPYMAQLRQSAMDYRASDMDGMMMQFEQTPTTVGLSGKDLYNPSAGELFGSAFGAGMSMFGATKSLTDNMKGKMGTTYINGGSGFNTASGKGWGELGKAMEEQQGLRDFSGANGQNMYMQEFNVPGANWNACGGHLHAIGGMFDNGAMAGQAINMLGAGIGVAINAAGVAAQRRKAEADAQVYNATKAFVDDRNKRNFGLAVEDSKNNMFNMQALQMMALGGDLHTQGSDFPMNGEFNVIGAGGTHEGNPFGGVFQGYAKDGKPNLVEQDEVVWNDYVFSKRLTVPKSFTTKYKLTEGIDFATAAQKLSAEASERPNDYISQNTMVDSLSALQAAQEEVRMKRQAAQMKREISKMSPEELAQLSQILSGQQTQQPQMAPEAAGIFSLGGYMFADGGSKGSGKGSRSSRRAAAREAEAKSKRDRALFGKRLDQVSDLAQLRRLASSIEGYNDADYQDTNAAANIRKFIEDNYDKVGGYEGLSNTMNTINTARLLQTRPDYNITETEGYSMSQDDWNRFFTGLDAYDVSRAARTADTQGKYNADTNFNNEGKTAAQVEQDQRYRAFKQYVRDQATKYAGGEDADENVLRYLQTLDRGINTGTGAQRLLQYDNEGNVVRDANGRVQFRQGWESDYDTRNYDQVGGIYHFYTDTPDITKTRTGERTIYRLNGQEIEYDPNTPNPFYTQTGTSTVDDGDGMRTNYIDMVSPQYSEEYEPEDEPGRQPIPRETISRYAPILGNMIGAFMDQPRDYSTSVPLTPASYRPIGDYLAYNPVDTQRYVNAENQQANAQLNAIMNATSGNRNAAMANAALANSQRIQGIGERMFQAEGINFGRKAQVGEFNRGTNSFNADAYNRAALANLGLNSQRLQQAQFNASMRHAVDNEADAAKSANLTALFDNLGNIGRENYFMNQVNSNRALDYADFGSPFVGGISGYKGTKKQ